jgi:hypothetical protein
MKAWWQLQKPIGLDCHESPSRGQAASSAWPATPYAPLLRSKKTSPSIVGFLAFGTESLHQFLFGVFWRGGEHDSSRKQNHEESSHECSVTLTERKDEKTQAQGKRHSQQI